MNPETASKVANDSKCHAENYTAKGNFGRAFAHYLIALKLKPDLQTVLKEKFASVLCNWGTTLEKDERFEDLFKCYEQAIEVFPKNEDILNNLGAHLLRHGSPKEAAYYFRQCLSIQPRYLRAHHNLENVSNLIVERWHFRMLNDEHRNDAFREAILKKIKQGYDCCLDIGTGTGLLSLFMLEGKAKQIYACDTSPTMIEICKQVLKNNNEGNVTVINKHSADLQIPDDISQKTKLVATEIMDSGLFGEQVLQTLKHAWAKLLLPPNSDLMTGKKTNGEHGIVIPFGATIYVAGIECDSISKELFIKKPENLSFHLYDYRFEQNEDNYDVYDLKRLKGGFKYLTEVEPVLYVNFNDPPFLEELLEGKHDKLLELKCIEAGRLDCIAMWFELRLDEDITINTGPESYVDNCWEQAIFPFSYCFEVEKDQEIRSNLSFLGGKLKVRKDEITSIQNNISSLLTEEKIFNPSREVILTINNCQLHQLILKSRERLVKRFQKSVHILDNWPFPVFGLDWIISRREKFHDKLTSIVSCDNDKRFVLSVAKKYDILNRVECIVGDELDDVLEKNGYFDIIMLNVVDSTGELKDRIVSQIDIYKQAVSPDGIVLPEEVIVMGRFIESEWLERTSKVIDSDVTCGYNIADYINVYKVQHNIDFDLASIEKHFRSDAFELFRVKSSETILKSSVPVSKSGSVNALVYWFNVYLLRECPEFTTLNEENNFHQAAFLLPTFQADDHINFSVIVNDGLFRIEVNY